MSDLKDRLEETKRESEWATTWRPDPGEVLVGRLVKMDTAETEYGEADVAHVRDEDGELWGVWLFHTVLEKRWHEADPEPGDRVGVLYLGKRSGSEFDYHAYKLQVERRDETEDRSPEESDLDGKEQAERLYDDGGGPEFEPNDSLPF